MRGIWAFEDWISSDMRGWFGEFAVSGWPFDGVGTDETMNFLNITSTDKGRVLNGFQSRCDAFDSAEPLAAKLQCEFCSQIIHDFVVKGIPFCAEGPSSSPTTLPTGHSSKEPKLEGEVERTALAIGCVAAGLAFLSLTMLLYFQWKARVRKRTSLGVQVENVEVKELEHEEEEIGQPEG